MSFQIGWNRPDLPIGEQNAIVAANGRRLIENLFPNGSMGILDSFDSDTKLLMVLVFLMTKKGQEIFKLAQPVLMELLQVLEKGMTSMLQASGQNNILAIPATLLFTNMCEKLMLVDHTTAAVCASLVTGITTADNIVDIIGNIAKIFKPDFFNQTQGNKTIVYSMGQGIREILPP